LAIRAGTIFELLRDLLVGTANRARRGEAGQRTLRCMFELLHSIIDDPDGISDITDISEKLKKGQVTAEIAGRGLGAAGRVEIPGEVWERYAPPNWEEAVNGTAPQRASRDPILEKLANRLVRDGLAMEVDPSLAPNARAFVLWKNILKCSLIVDMRETNKRCLPAQYQFKLPSLEVVARMLQAMDAESGEVFMTKLDVSNHFWSCRFPEHVKGRVRIGVGGRVFELPSLPFGWTHSPPIAQKLLAITLAKKFPGQVVVVQYVDDILIIGFNKAKVAEATQHIIAIMIADGWLVSPKSEVEPKSRITWMGKQVDTDLRQVAPTPGSMVGTIVLWLKLAAKGYRVQWLARAIGKLHWMGRPGYGLGPFLAGATAWKLWGPVNAKYTPPNVLRGLAEAFAFAFCPWQAVEKEKQRRLAESSERWYVDAAYWKGSYYAGLWAEKLGTRVWRAPPWIRSQQQAELWSMEMGLKVVAYRRKQGVTLVGDNMAAVHSLKRLRAGVGHWVQNRILKRVIHLLRWSGAHVNIAWVGSKDNPADPMSRVLEWPSTQAAFLAAWRIGLRTEAFHETKVFHWGEIRYRG
jgi:hypothetical protein